MSAPIGVGFLGAGPVTQAIHLPTVARLGDTFRIAGVMDARPDLARSVAASVDARPTSSMRDLLADPAVEVVAVCSPHQFHAEQVVAACEAGKRAVLCEKPFAMSQDEAESIAAVSARTGVPILVGAMHTYDPGWLAARDNWGDLADAAHLIRSSIVLPPNSRFEDFATEVESGPPPPMPGVDPPDAAARVHGGVMGLAIHDLPLIRTFLPEARKVEVLWAEALDPFGYLIVLRCGRKTVELHAVMSRNWAPSWALEAVSDETLVRVEFTPSYVQAGSAVAHIYGGGGGTVTSYGPYDHNGYEGEWRELAEVARGGTPATSTADLIDDLAFALTLADLAADRSRRVR